MFFMILNFYLCTGCIDFDDSFIFFNYQSQKNTTKYIGVFVRVYFRKQISFSNLYATQRSVQIGTIIKLKTKRPRPLFLLHEHADADR